MRLGLLGLGALLLSACLAPEPVWLVTSPRFRGVTVEVVESGGYGSLLNVPAGRRRATILPLDTVEFAWSVAAPQGVSVAPPIWIYCSHRCAASAALEVHADALEDCPEPLPFGVDRSCRLGEGHRIRVAFGGAFTNSAEVYAPRLLIIGSRSDELTPATCLERASTRPRAELASCILGVFSPGLGPAWAAVPFSPEASVVPPEVLAQEVDVHPEVLGFSVTRERGDARIELLVPLGEPTSVRPGERVTVAPVFAEGSIQDYWVSVGEEEGIPWSGTLTSRTEQPESRFWFDAAVHGFDPQSYDDWSPGGITFVIPDDFASTLLYVDVQDDRYARHGRAFVELLLVPADDPS